MWLEIKILKRDCEYFRSGRHVVQRPEAALQGILAETGGDSDAGRAVPEIRQYHEKTPEAAETAVESPILPTRQSYQAIGLEAEGWPHGIHLRDIPGEEADRQLRQQFVVRRQE